MDALRLSLDGLSLRVCSCTSPCCEAAITHTDMDDLWVHLRDRVNRQSPRFDGILANIPLVDIPPSSSSSEAAHAESGNVLHPIDPQIVPVQVDWLHGLGADIFSLVLCQISISDTGAVAASCKMLHELAHRDEIWRAHARELEVDITSATGHRNCRSLCRDLCHRSRLDEWLHAVDAIERKGGAALPRVMELFEDGQRRLSRLQPADYRDAQSTRRPPQEFALAARLLHALWTIESMAALEGSPDGSLTDVDAEEPSGAVAWLQRLLPQITGKRGEQAQVEVSKFIGRFYEYQSDGAPADRIAAVEALLPSCCLVKLDEAVERRVREGYPMRGGGCGPSEVLRASRVASAIIRWVVATVQLLLIRRRAAQLNAVTDVILRCKADTPAVRRVLV